MCAKNSLRLSSRRWSRKWSFWPKKMKRPPNNPALYSFSRITNPSRRNLETKTTKAWTISQQKSSISCFTSSMRDRKAPKGKPSHKSFATRQWVRERLTSTKASRMNCFFKSKFQTKLSRSSRQSSVTQKKISKASKQMLRRVSGRLS